MVGFIFKLGLVFAFKVTELTNFSLKMWTLSQKNGYYCSMKSPIDITDNNIKVPESSVHHIDCFFRLVAILLVFSAVDFNALSSEHPALTASLLGFGALLYTVIAFLLARGHSEYLPASRISNTMEYTDVLLLGLLTLSLEPAWTMLVATLVIIAIRAVAIGGIPTVCGHFSTFVLGGTILFAARQPIIVVQPQETFSAIGALVVPAFLVFVGWCLYQRQSSLETALKASELVVKQLKVNNYKLARYLSPSLRKAISSGKRVSLETQRKKVSVFFSDIKGFSELSEELETDTLTDMINLYLTEMSEIALKFGGTIDKFIGDAIMVFFGDPTSRGAKEDAVACVAMALAMQKRMQDLNQRWSAQGIGQHLGIRMGVNTGFCTVGNFGTQNRMDYTLLGTEVNLASRLESACQAGEVMISRSTYELVKDIIYCEARGHFNLKGFNEPIEIFSAVDLRKNLGKDNLCIDKFTDGFSIYLDVENIPHLQKQPVLATLEKAYDQIRQDINRVTRDDIKIIK
jgi:adenylate cyclase